MITILAAINSTAAGSLAAAATIHSPLAPWPRTLSLEPFAPGPSLLATNHRSPITGTGHRSPFTDYRSLITDY